ncbi:MAG: hypothetical protein U5K30_01495 [Acidimicrobiales bacterium]|nr:hypothetical protein [Acidimicrobiales bacterium]
MRATSALLAVIEIVRDVSLEMFAPLGATKAQRAEVRCYTEVPFKLGAGKKTSRPDGLVQITYGKSTWTALLEVKTGDAVLDAEQVNAYWDIAREQDFDAVVTVSNEIAPSKDAHPTDGLKVRSNSRVKVHHYSWTAIQSMCEVIKDHHGVEDPEQAWILSELVRYLRHPNSGANAFDDMGGNWVAVRDAARDDGLRKSDDGVRDIAERWDQLLRYAALRLEADIGETVTQQLPSSQKEPSKRLNHLVERLAGDGQLDGTLRIPNTVGDLELAVDLRARRISASVTASAPEDRGGRARCTWLAGQLGDDVDRRTVIEAYAKKAKTPTTATLEQVREDKDCLLGDDKRDPYRFKIVLSREMGIARKTGRKSAGFIDSVLALITEFYGTVVQNITPWTPKAPKMTRSEPSPEPDTVPHRSEMQRVPQPLEDPDEDSTGPRLPAASAPDIDEGTDERPPAASDPWLRVHRF